MHSGDTCPGWPLVRACEGGVDLLIHECFPPAAALAAATGLSIERATMALNAAHTSPAAAGKVFSLVRPRMAGLLAHVPLAPGDPDDLRRSCAPVYDGPVVQTQDLTVFNVTKDAVVARQAQVIDQLPPIAGEQRVAYTPVLPDASRMVGRGTHPDRRRRATAADARCDADRDVSRGTAQSRGRSRRAIRTPRAAALAGIAFSVLFTVALVLVRSAVPADPGDAGQWLTDSSRRDAVMLALGLVPFAGIAFLWFIGVMRDRVGAAEDRFFATVFLGSGLLFVGMLFVASAVAAGLVAASGDHADSLLSSGAWAVGRSATDELIVVYAMRMAAVFTLAASTILMRTRVAPRWLVVSGYAIAVLLLITVGHFAWIELVFPAWVLVLSLYVLVTSFRGTPEAVPSA